MHLTEAQTVYGKIGVKVWVCRGEKFGKVDLSPVQKSEKPQRKGSNRRPERKKEIKIKNYVTVQRERNIERCRKAV